MLAALLTADGQPAVWVEPLLGALATGILALIGWAFVNWRGRIKRETKDEDRLKDLSDRIDALSNSIEKLVENKVEHAMMEVALGRQQCRAEVDRCIADAARHNDLVAQEVRQLHEAINELKRLVQSTQKDVNRLASAVAMHRTQTGSFRLDPAPADDEGENGGEPSK